MRETRWADLPPIHNLKWCRRCNCVVVNIINLPDDVEHELCRGLGCGAMAKITGVADG